MNKFNKSLFDDKPKILARIVRAKNSSEAVVEIGTPPLPAADQLRIGLDGLEGPALSVLNREGISVAIAVTRPANTPAGRAGRIAAGVQAVRRTLVSPEATEAALTTYWLMQQFAAASLDEWREEVRRGVDAVKRQRKAAGSSKRRAGYDAVADYLVRTFGAGLKPSRIWAKLRDDTSKKPPPWNMAGMVVTISQDGKKISCGFDDPITKVVFLKAYLKPAREAAAKR